MADRPEQLPEWATEDQVDDVSGQNNVVEPPSERKESGWDRREIPPRQWQNWLARLYYRWIDYIVSILDAATNDETPDTLAKRDAAGRMRAEDPKAAQDVVTLGYLTASGNLDLSQNGFYKFPGGLILQWVSDVVVVGDNEGDAESVTIDLPTTDFSDVLQSGCMQGHRTTKDGGDSEAAEMVYSVESISSTDITLKARRVAGSNNTGTEKTELVGFVFCKE